MRFVITEEEKNRIRVLYEQTTGDKLVAKKNPYKYPEFQDLEPKEQRGNWGKRKNETMYYDYDKSLLYTAITKALSDFYVPLLLNKTMRSDKNDNLRITKVEPRSRVNIYDDFTDDETNYELKLYFNNDKNLYTTLDMPGARPSRYTRYNVPDNYKAGDYISTNTTNFFTVPPSQQLIDYLKEKPFNWMEVRKKLPDNIFSIYKKSSTDFQP